MPHNTHGKKKHDQHRHQERKKPGLHKDWKTWTAVLLMLAAVAAYVLSDNEALAPNDGDRQMEMEAGE